MYKISNVQVSAQGGSFFAYSSSMVLEGDAETTPEALPIIIPELQDRSVISVVSCGGHSGALTSSGKLLTWGRCNGGTLGLGGPWGLPVGSPGGYAEEEQRAGVRAGTYYEDPPDVRIPVEVRFDHRLRANGRVERYCFAVAKGRWHTAALVFDLAGDEAPPEDLEQAIGENLEEDIEEDIEEYTYSLAL